VDSHRQLSQSARLDGIFPFLKCLIAHLATLDFRERSLVENCFAWDRVSSRYFASTTLSYSRKVSCVGSICEQARLCERGLPRGVHIPSRYVLTPSNLTGDRRQNRPKLPSFCSAGQPNRGWKSRARRGRDRDSAQSCTTRGLGAVSVMAMLRQQRDLSRTLIKLALQRSQHSSGIAGLARGRLASPAWDERLLPFHLRS